eukprot:5800352-Prymnesium_polylepis.2
MSDFSKLCNQAVAVDRPSAKLCVDLKLIRMHMLTHAAESTDSVQLQLDTWTAHRSCARLWRN